MQRTCRAAISLFGKRVSLGKLINNAAFGRGISGAERQCTSSAESKEDVPLYNDMSQHMAPALLKQRVIKSKSDSLSCAATMHANGSTASPSPITAVIIPRQYPSLVKRKAAAALRMQQRAETAAQAQLSKARESAAKVRALSKLKAAAAKEKAREQKAKAKVQKAKTEKLQRKELLGKRAPSAYALFLLDTIKGLGHLPHHKRFEAISVQYKQLTPEKTQMYTEAAAKHRAELAARRAAITLANPVKVYRPQTAYLLYCQDKFPEIKAANQSTRLVDIVRLIAKQWQGVSESDKQQLRARVALLTAGAVQRH